VRFHRRWVIGLVRKLGLVDRSNFPFASFDRIGEIDALRAAILPRVSHRRVIFCINPGRCGSAYLANLLATVPHARSHHEPRPAMNGKYLALIDAAPLSESRARRSIKCLAVAADLLLHPRAPFYSETNHMFIKTFCDVVVDDFRDVDVIVLRRDPAAVLKSMIELMWFSNASNTWQAWASVPGGANSASLPVAHERELDQFDRAISYLVDIEARTSRFIATHPRVSCQSFQLEEITTPRGARAMFEALALPWSDQAERQSRQVVNARSDIKAYYGNITSLETCRARIHDYVQRALTLGIDIPPTLSSGLTGPVP